MKKNNYLARIIMIAIPVAMLFPLNVWGTDFIFAIDRNRDGSTHVFTLSGANDFQSPIDSFKTILNSTDSTWEFLVGDYNQDGRPDLYAIAKQGTGSGRTELHILDGATGFRRFLRQTPTALDRTDANWSFVLGDYDANGGTPDLYAIAKQGTNSGRIELHVLKGQADYAEFRRQVATGLPQGNENWTFALATQRANPAPQCMNGVDDDNDGKIDSADPGCTSSGDDDESDPPPPPPPPPPTQCNNGRDDDGDGKVDLQDPGCRDTSDNDETDSPSSMVNLNLTIRWNVPSDPRRCTHRITYQISPIAITGNTGNRNPIEETVDLVAIPERGANNDWTCDFRIGENGLAEGTWKATVRDTTGWSAICQGDLKSSDFNSGLFNYTINRPDCGKGMEFP